MIFLHLIKKCFLYFFLFFQVQLLYELAEITSKVWNKIQRKGILYQSSVYPETVTGPAPPSSPVKSSIGTAPPDTSTYSPSADIGTTTEVSFPFLKKKKVMNTDLQDTEFSQVQMKSINKE